MPFLVKSVGGNRTCQRIPSSTNFNSDILAALKGLTLTLELKVVGVESSPQGTTKITLETPSTNSTQDESPKQISGDDQRPVQFRNSDTNVRRDLKLSTSPSPSPSREQKDLDSIRADLETHLPKGRSTLRPGTVENLVPGIVREKLHQYQAKEDLAKPQVPIPKQENPPAKQQQQDPLWERMGSPVPSTPSPDLLPLARIGLDRASIKIGTVMKAYVLEVERKSSKEAVAYVSRDNEAVMSIVNLIAKLKDDIAASAVVPALEIGDLVFAQSMDDDQWYRAVVEDKNGSDIYVFFFDWGLREQLDISRTRILSHPQLGLAKYPANSLKLRLVETPTDVFSGNIEEGTTISLQITAFDSKDSCYLAKVLEN